ncbi:hypothetical protein A0H81_00581 [Grifola frondosa]|uniref:Uncharacterized protein n=1 Tax=Grifola frondosa TaxID=5627 RepID=A0A1C7MRN8_GRIFR|nr:hypothetical protein A0H81_00581 [Grifola frondosa]
MACFNLSRRICLLRKPTYLLTSYALYSLASSASSALLGRRFYRLVEARPFVDGDIVLHSASPLLVHPCHVIVKAALYRSHAILSKARVPEICSAVDGNDSYIIEVAVRHKC